MARTKKQPAAPVETPLQEELLDSLLRFIQESGPAGVNRSVIDTILSRKVAGGDIEREAWRHLEELMRRGEITEANRGGAQPFYVALDQTRFKQWAKADAGGEAAEERKTARRKQRQASRNGQGDEPNAAPGKPARASRKPRGAAPGASADGAWTVLRKGPQGEFVIGKFDDKSKARATARKSRLNGHTVLIMDEHDQVTNEYRD